MTDELMKSSAGHLSVWMVNKEEDLRSLLEAGIRNITKYQPDSAMKLRGEIQSTIITCSV